MSCSRCCGLMVKDNLMDFDGTSGHMWMSAMRCMNCGHVHDPVNVQVGRHRARIVAEVDLRASHGSSGGIDDPARGRARGDP